MNSPEVLFENLASAAKAEVGSFTPEDEAHLKRVVKALNAKTKVGCTGCGYCMPCPKNVDIPGTFSAYNRRYTEGKFHGLVDYVMCTALRKNSTAAGACIGCGKCEKHCPQGIRIREELKKAAREFEGPVYRVFSGLAKKFTHF